MDKYTVAQCVDLLMNNEVRVMYWVIPVCLNSRNTGSGPRLEVPPEEIHVVYIL